MWIPLDTYIKSKIIVCREVWYVPSKKITTFWQPFPSSENHIPRITDQSGNPGTFLREAELTYNEFLKGAHISLKHILSSRRGFVLHKRLLISSKQPNLFLSGSFNATKKKWSFKRPTVFVFGKYFPGCYTLVLTRPYLSYL